MKFGFSYRNSWMVCAVFLLTALLPAQEPVNHPLIWQDPGDIAGRDLLHTGASPNEMPQAPFTFLKEDMSGTNPKFDIRDATGNKWRVKLGVEARPEVAASRLLGSIGYFTPELYYFPVLHVSNMPLRLKRGQAFRSSNGMVYGARLKRMPPKGHKVDIWHWRKNPFCGSRELNGLRVMMALLNNPDLKDQNNGIFLNGKAVKDIPEVYMISDLGSCFSGAQYPPSEKGNLKSYTRRPFIRKIRSTTVDFNLPTGPQAIDFPLFMWGLYSRQLRWIASDIPRTDAKWVGDRLGELSRAQIESAFVAAGFSAEDVQGFAEEIMKRIAALQSL